MKTGDALTKEAASELKHLSLAKPALDIGLFTNQADQLASFWQEAIGAEFDHILPISKTVRQHRHTFGHGVLKINQSKQRLKLSGPSGFGRILVAQDGVADAVAQQDPDGNLFQRTPMGDRGLKHWAIEVKVPSLDVFLRFYHQALGLPRAEEHPGAVAVGDSLIIAEIDPDLKAPEASHALEYLGLRYFTIQVFDVDAIHAQVTALGWQAPMPPTTLGSTARIAFVTDPAGNWIELSQRASLTGPLPID